jgi:peptidyl-prolyl cis-trans isomerase C
MGCVGSGVVAWRGLHVLGEPSMIQHRHAAPTRFRSFLVMVGVTTALALVTTGCREEALKKSGGAASASGLPAQLTPAQAGMVLATVGDKNITLGDFAAALERMDQFDRLRYQTPERRRELLDHMVTVELLAREARRRGMDNDPQVKEAYRQILREALLTEARKGVADPASIPEAEVRAYYESHAAEFEEPERRRVGHIMVKDKDTAEKLLQDARKANAAQWGELALKHSIDAPGKNYKGPSELVGDLGFVGPPNDARGANPRVPEEVRAAVFQIAAPGEVLDHPVADAEGRWHIVRLVAKTDAHMRPFAEAERLIRVTLVQQEIAKREKALEDELRQKYPVTIDDSALAAVKAPPAASHPNPHGPPGMGHAQ